eukprot:TRINITY_DN3617_c0_g1_i1.p1 TRINITY_DN3617_c0_g1~~TRINITY_DN3617_c0_g1_i1.p1  ORF type:complete len:274 (+),score=48.35 TRINITY_DN3617_c0_g1_i1:617-1438(+)
MSSRSRQQTKDVPMSAEPRDTSSGRKSVLQELISSESKSAPAPAAPEEFPKAQGKTLTKELEEDKIVRDSQAGDFAVSFANYIQKGYVLKDFEAVLHSESLMTRYKYDPEDIMFKTFSEISYLMHQDAAAVEQQLSEWLQKGFEPFSMFSSNGVWLVLGGKKDNSTYGNLLSKTAVLTVSTTTDLMTCMKHYCSNGHVLRCGGFANDTWILILEKTTFPFQWQWSSYQTLAIANQTVASGRGNTWIGPIYASGFYYLFCYKRITPTTTTTTNS